MIQFDDHIVQMGWFNHQLVSYLYLYPGEVPKPVGNPEDSVWKIGVHLRGITTPGALRILLHDYDVEPRTATPQRPQNTWVFPEIVVPPNHQF